MGANGEGGEDGAAIAFRAAVDGRFDMLETGLDRDPVTRKKGQLRRATRQAFQRRQAISYRELPDRIHLRVEIHRRQPRARVADLGDAQADLRPHIGERIGSHQTLLSNGRCLTLVKQPLRSCFALMAVLGGGGGAGWFFAGFAVTLPNIIGSP